MRWDIESPCGLVPLCGREGEKCTSCIYSYRLDSTYVCAYIWGEPNGSRLKNDKIVGKSHWCGMPIERALGYVWIFQTLVPRMRHLLCLLPRIRSKVILRIKNVYCQDQMQNRPCYILISIEPWCGWSRTPSVWVWLSLEGHLVYPNPRGIYIKPMSVLHSLTAMKAHCSHVQLHPLEDPARWPRKRVGQRNWWYGSLLDRLEGKHKEIEYDLIRGEEVNEYWRTVSCSSCPCR